MLTTITDANENSRLDEEFRRLIWDAPGGVQMRFRVSSRGTRGPPLIHEGVYFPQLDIWYVRENGPGMTRWNHFGIGKPLSPPATNAIAAEMNFPTDGSLNHHARFAREGNGTIVLLNAGPGGGRKGVTPRAFQSSSNVPTVIATEKGATKDFARVATMAPGMLAEFTSYVRAVKAFRETT
jgi:hypothetical protein